MHPCAFAYSHIRRLNLMSGYEPDLDPNSFVDCNIHCLNLMNASVSVYDYTPHVDIVVLSPDQELETDRSEILHLDPGGDPDIYNLQNNASEIIKYLANCEPDENLGSGRGY
jgi:hypothetical protein